MTDGKPTSPLSVSHPVIMFIQTEPTFSPHCSQMRPFWYRCSLKFWQKNLVKYLTVRWEIYSFLHIWKVLQGECSSHRKCISIAVPHSWHDFRVWREVSPLQTCSVNKSVRAEPLHALGPCSNVSVLRVQIFEQFPRRESKFQFCSPTPGVPIADFKLKDAAVSQLWTLVYNILPPTTGLIFVCHKSLETG